MIKEAIVTLALMVSLATPSFSTEMTINWSYPQGHTATGFRIYDKANTVLEYYDGALREGILTYTFAKQCESFYITADWTNPETGVTRESPISNLFTVCLEDEEIPVVETFIITVKKVIGE